MNREKHIPYIWLAIGAAALLFTGGKYNFFLAAWIGNVFLIRFMRSRKPWIGFLITAVTAGVISMISWYGIQPMSGIEYVISMLVTATISTLPLLADRLLYRRLPGWLGTLVFPAASTAIEFAFVSANPMGSFGAIAYSQFAFTPFIQFASIAGLTGIAFLLYWFPSLVNLWWEKSWKSNRPLLIASAIVYVSVMSFGVVRMAISRGASEVVEVSMIVRGDGDTNLRSVLGRGTYAASAAEKLVSGYEELTVSKAASGSRIIAWPEGAVAVPSDELPGIRRRLGELSRDAGIYLVAPYVSLGDESYENGLDIYSPAGDIVLNHIKFGGNVFEGSVPGKPSLDYVDTEYGRLSAAVCWDMDFPEVVRQAGEASVDIMISPSCEWREIVPTHAQMAVFRGVENGMSTVHPATLGLSVAADSRGRILESLNWFDSSASALSAEVPIHGTDTLYAQVGEIFGPLSGLLTAVLILYGSIAAILARRKRK